uniref:Uncharacterized protein n=1 Tax=Anguilla anguilla TaxID=7936 RepID=A0A0E9WQG2_ANGAN
MYLHTAEYALKQFSFRTLHRGLASASRLTSKQTIFEIQAQFLNYTKLSNRH